MSDKKIITVFGATGAQGGGLVRAIQADKNTPFQARAVTRDVNSHAAEALAALGAEVVAADLGDAESVARAMHGAHGAYCVTFYWAHLSPQRELADARTLAEAARREQVSHVIWSTLEDTRKWMGLDDARMPTIEGHYKVPHLDVKGEADAFFADLATTYLLTSFYWDNIVSLGMNPQPDGQGGYVFALPMGEAKLPGVAAEDIGKVAYGVFKAGETMIGQRVAAVGEHVSGADMAATMAEALGARIRYLAMEPADYRALGFPGADDLGNMFQFKRDFEADYRGARDVEAARRLNPELQDFRTWVARNGARIPLP